MTALTVKERYDSPEKGKEFRSVSQLGESEGRNYEDFHLHAEEPDSKIPNWVWGAWVTIGIAGAGLLTVGLLGHFAIGALSNLDKLSYLPVVVGIGLMLGGGIGAYKLWTRGKKDSRLELNKQLQPADIPLDKGQFTIVPTGKEDYRVFEKGSETNEEALEQVKFYRTPISEEIYLGRYLASNDPLNSILNAGQYTVVPSGESEANVYARDQQGPVFVIAENIKGRPLEYLEFELKQDYKKHEQLV